MVSTPSRPATGFTPASAESFLRPSMDTAMAVTSSLLKGWSTIGETWMALWQSQIDSNLKLLQSLAKCDNPVTALNLHLDGARETMTRCMTTATTTQDIASKVAAEALAPLRNGFAPTSHAA